MPIPLHRYDGALIDFISPKRAEKLFDGGHRCWTLKSLSGDRSETDVAPDELRPLFLSALRGCLEAA